MITAIVFRSSSPLGSRPASGRRLVFPRAALVLAMTCTLISGCKSPRENGAEGPMGDGATDRAGDAPADKAGDANGPSGGSGGSSHGSGGSSGGSGGATSGGASGGSPGSGGSSGRSGDASTADAGAATTGTGGSDAGSDGSAGGSGGALADTGSGGRPGSGGVKAKGSGGAMAASGGMTAASGGMTAASGGAPAGSGGMMGSGGTTAGCGSGMKLCNGMCVSQATCCPTCGGNTPVCDNGTCVARTNSMACSGDGECASGHCADGVCCNDACTGQCESCNTSSAKGTCSPTTTPRSACAGSGTCAGKCDGSTANRKSCVYPGGSTTCGSPACSGGKATAAPTCNGSGACGSTPAPMTCMFGCTTSGTPGCATSCPSGQATCGGSTCIDVTSDKNNCGTSCTACTNSTPVCISGSCRQCGVASDCSTTGANGRHPRCNANTCACRVKDANNVLKSPGFDNSSALGDWGGSSVGTLVTSTDGDNCSSSGCVLVNNGFDGIKQCVQVSGGKKYYLGFSALNSLGDAMSCALTFYSDQCTTSIGGLALAVQTSTGSNWQDASGSATSPSNAKWALVACAPFEGQEAYIDQVYLNGSSDNF